MAEKVRVTMETQVQQSVAAVLPPGALECEVTKKFATKSLPSFCTAVSV